MQISIKRGLTFLANPKCGTTSVEGALKGRCDQYIWHQNRKTFKCAQIPEHLGAIFKITISKTELFCCLHYTRTHF